MKLMNTKQLISVGVLSIGALLSTTSQAASCNGVVSGPISNQVCTLTGPNVTWQYNITTLTTSGALALFDGPTLIGDNIRFLPPSFVAQSIGGSGPALTTGNFIFTHVFRNDGGNILGFSSSDIGDYAITNAGCVQGDLYMQAADNTNALRFANKVTTTGQICTPTGGALTGWNLTTTVDGTTPNPLGPPFLPIIAAPDFAVNVQDTLQASTTTSPINQIAFIQKKINIDVVVPVPAAAWLFGSALGLLGLRRTRGMTV
jgi:hypothetical protein